MTFEKVVFNLIDLPTTLEELGDPEGKYNGIKLADWIYYAENSVVEIDFNYVYNILFGLGEILYPFNVTRFYAVDDKIQESTFLYVYVPVDQPSLGLSAGWYDVDMSTENVSTENLIPIDNQPFNLYINRDNWETYNNISEQGGYEEILSDEEGVPNYDYSATYTRLLQVLECSSKNDKGECLDSEEELEAKRTIIRNSLLRPQLEILDESNWKEFILNRPNFLASAVGLRLTTYTLSNTYANIVEENDRKIIKAGSIYPTNDSEVIGIVYQDVDVTNGDKDGALMIGGVYYEDILTEEVSAEAKEIFIKNGLYSQENSSIVVPDDGLLD